MPQQLLRRGRDQSAPPRQRRQIDRFLAATIAACSIYPTPCASDASFASHNGTAVVEWFSGRCKPPQRGNCSAQRGRLFESAPAVEAARGQGRAGGAVRSWRRLSRRQGRGQEYPARSGTILLGRAKGWFRRRIQLRPGESLGRRDTAKF